MFWIVWLYLNIGSCFSEDLLPFECLHFWNSLAVSGVKETTWWPNNSGSWDPTHAFSNLIVIWYLHPFCIHFFCVSLKQLQSWTLNLLIADSWHPVPWPYPPHLEDHLAKVSRQRDPSKLKALLSKHSDPCHRHGIARADPGRSRQPCAVGPLAFRCVLRAHYRDFRQRNRLQGWSIALGALVLWLKVCMLISK